MNPRKRAYETLQRTNTLPAVKNLRRGSLRSKPGRDGTCTRRTLLARQHRPCGTCTPIFNVRRILIGDAMLPDLSEPRSAGHQCRASHRKDKNHKESRWNSPLTAPRLPVHSLHSEAVRHSCAVDRGSKEDRPATRRAGPFRNIPNSGTNTVTAPFGAIAAGFLDGRFGVWPAHLLSSRFGRPADGKSFPISRDGETHSSLDSNRYLSKLKTALTVCGAIRAGLPAVASSSWRRHFDFGLCR